MDRFPLLSIYVVSNVSYNQIKNIYFFLKVSLVFSVLYLSSFLSAKRSVELLNVLIFFGRVFFVFLQMNISGLLLL